MSKKELTAKQRMFVKEYLIDLNATQAAIRAGYSEKTAAVIGCQNLMKVNVAEAIQREVAARAERTEVTQDWVVEKIKRTVERCEGSLGEDGEPFNPNALLKGTEQLGRHLRMFGPDINAPAAVFILNMHLGGRE